VSLSKKPPPDTVENLLGRMGLIRTSARMNAYADSREGSDYDQALTRRMREVESKMIGLESRLERMQKGIPGDRSRSVPKKSPKLPSEPQEVSKQAEPSLGDLLDELGAL
jgi:hypothetical protein